MTSEEAFVEYELARNEAMDKWFDARPNVNRSRQDELIFEGAFRMAWQIAYTHYASESDAMMQEREK